MIHRFFAPYVGALAIFGTLAALAQDADKAKIEPPAPYDLSQEKGPHHRIVEEIEPFTNKETGLTEVRTNRVVHLESGMHYWQDGEWKESRDLIELESLGAVARQGPMKVTFNPNLNTESAIDLLTSDDKRLRSSILGINYFDAASGRSVVLAEVQDSQGEYLPPNQIVYKNAFTKLKADVRYTYRKGMFEQDVILLENPPPPEQFGLDPVTTRLEVFTEFFQPPAPDKRTILVKEEQDAQKRQAMIEPDLIDHDLDFGQIKKGWGKGFAVPEEGEAEATQPVFKRWEKIENRDFLIEIIEYNTIKDKLAKLPAAAQAPDGQKEGASLKRILPRRQTAQNWVERNIQMASALYRPKGYVIDYQDVATAANVTFWPNVTYRVTNTFTLTGTTTVSSGTVVKFVQGASITVSGGSFTSPSSGTAYFVSADHPTSTESAISTGHDINSSCDSNPLCGNGSACSAGGNPCLSFVSLGASTTIQNLEFRNVTKALHFYSPTGGHTVQYCTFRDCGTAVEAYYTSGAIQNCSACNVSTVYSNTGGSSFSVSTPSGVCDDIGNTRGTSSPISIGGSASGSISYAGDVDYFTFTSTTSATLTITSSGTTDVYGYVVNSACGVIAYNDDSNGNYQFLMTANVSPGTYYIAVRHYNPSNASGSYTVQIQNGTPNNSPTISSIATQSFGQDGSTGAIPFSVNDTETPVGNLTVTAISSNPSVVPTGNLVHGGSGANRTIQVIGAPGSAGSAQITVTVTDGGFASTTTSFTVNVTSRMPNLVSTASYSGNGYAAGTITFPNPYSATIRYTTDGSIPTSTSTIYTGPLTYSSPTRVYAKAFKGGYIESGHIGAWVSKLPQAKIASASGLVTSDFTVNNSIDIWLIPNFGSENTYGENLSLSGWNGGGLAFSTDAPDAHHRGSIQGSGGVGAYQVNQIETSHGRTYSMAGWFRAVAGSAVTYAGFDNYTAANVGISADDINTIGASSVAYLTQPLANGATTAYLFNEGLFSPVSSYWHENLFVPLLNFSSSGTLLGANQPNTVKDLMQAIPFSGNPSSSQAQVTSVNTSAHTVTFSPAYSGSTLPVGTMIARRAAGSTYQYQLLSGAVVPAGWTRYTATFGTFRAGTEKIRLITLLGYAAGATTGFTGLEFWEGTQSDRPNLYYTLDGNSAVYSQTPVAGPVKITLTGNKPGTSSRVINLGQRGTCYIDATTLQRTITFKAATPTLTFEYLSGNQVKVTATCATAGAIFRYTTDGSEPVDASPSFANNVTTTASATIKVKAFKTDYVPSDTVGRLAPPSFSPPGATFENDTTVTISAPAGASLKILRSNRNYLDTSTWVLNSQGTQPGFNAFGSASENIIESGLNPFGTIEKVWAAYNDAASGADGGWDSAWFNVDKTKTYRFSVWIKKTGSNSGYSFLGCGGGTVSTLTGSASESIHNNPYFYANNTIPLNEWCLIVGFIHPAGHTGTTSYGKIYNAQGGIITACTDYKWLNATINSYHRTYLNDCTDPSVRQYFWNPKVEEVISLTDPVDVYFASPVASPQTISLAGNLGNYISAMSYLASSSTPYSGAVQHNYIFPNLAVRISRPRAGTNLP